MPSSIVLPQQEHCFQEGGGIHSRAEIGLKCVALNSVTILFLLGLKFVKFFATSPSDQTLSV